MTPEMVMEIGRNALETTLIVAAPMLGMSLVVGLLVSLFQALTQINEPTLSFVPKLVGMFVAMMLFFPWMVRLLTGFLATIILSIPQYAR
ncbi:MAG: flagellar biosynthesis protein FliQ [Nitrospiraceae bacterium]